MTATPAAPLTPEQVLLLSECRLARAIATAAGTTVGRRHAEDLFTCELIERAHACRWVPPEFRPGQEPAYSGLLLNVETDDDDVAI